MTTERSWSKPIARICSLQFINRSGELIDIFTIASGTPHPDVSITATDDTASESGTDPATFTISRTGSTSDPLTVNYTVNGTATNGSDYNLLSGSVTIPIGASSAPVDVIPIDDSIPEWIETVDITLDLSTSYNTGAIFSASATIIDDEVTIAPLTTESRVDSSSDDAEEEDVTGNVNLNSSDLELVFDGNNQTVGMRFNPMAIPPGATIVDAYIQFEVDEVNTVATSLTIEGEDVDDAVTFSSTDYDISSRTRTAASVSWSPPPWTSSSEAGVDQRTPNLAIVVQEIVDRSGWSTCNSMVMTITGTGERTAESYDGEENAAPLLHVRYSTDDDMINDPPVLCSIGNQFVAEGDTITFTAIAADPDGSTNILTYSLDPGAPAGASIDPASGLFTWSPSETDGPGSYPVTVRVTDDGSPSLDDSESFTITATETNQPPVLGAIGNQTVDEGNTLSFTAAATNPDLPANSLTFTLDAGAPAGASIDPVSGAFSWTPGEADGPGSFPVTVRVTDDGTPALDDLESITITVNEVNEPPVLGTVGNQSVDEGNTLSFTAAATDPDLPANSLTFTLDAGAPAGASIDAVSGAFSWTPREADGPGSFPVTVRVTDDGTPSLDDSETITITVAEVNLAPVLGAIGDQTVVEGDTLSFTATATDPDLPANTLMFVLEPGAPIGATIDPVSGAFSWTTVEADGPGSYPVTVSVSDGGSPNLNDSETISITVEERVTVERQVAAGTDDAEERPSGRVLLGSADLELVFDVVGDQVVGIRFTGTDIPPRATIHHSYLQFTADEAHSVATSLTIQGEDIGNAPTFTSANGSISSRARTSALVDWSPGPWMASGDAGPAQRPDVTPIIQEIVNRPDWSSSSALAIIITGTGERVAASFNGDPQAAPLLHVEFTTETTQMATSATILPSPSDEPSDGQSGPTENGSGWMFDTTRQDTLQFGRQRTMKRPSVPTVKARSSRADLIAKVMQALGSRDTTDKSAKTALPHRTRRIPSMPDPQRFDVRTIDQILGTPDQEWLRFPSSIAQARQLKRPFS